MSAVQITIDDTQVNAAIERVARAGIDTAPLMRKIEGMMLFAVQRRFETEKGPGGTPWQRLAPRTANKRLGRTGRRRGEANILRVTNRLYSSISGESDATSAEVGTNLVYGPIHQEGGTITQYAQSRTVRFRKVGGKTQFARRAHKRVTEKKVTFGERTITIPARPYLGFDDELRGEVVQAAETHFREAAGSGAR